VTVSPPPTAPQPAVAGYPCRAAPNDALQARALCRPFATAGITEIGVISRDDDYGRGIANLTESLYKAAPFNGQVTKVMYDPLATNHANEITALSTALAGYGADAQTAVLIIAFESDGLDTLHRARQDVTVSSVRWLDRKSTRLNSSH